MKHPTDIDASLIRTQNLKRIFDENGNEVMVAACQYREKVKYFAVDDRHKTWLQQDGTTAHVDWATVQQPWEISKTYNLAKFRYQLAFNVCSISKQQTLFFGVI